MAKHGIAILGAGMIGAAHAAGYRTYLPRFAGKLDGLSLATVCDENEAMANSLRANFGFARTSRDWKAVLDDPEIGIVSIALPNFLHVESVSLALERGKHVICEKPLALTAVDAEKLYRKAQASNRCSATVFNYRRLPAVAAIKELVAAVEIGAPVQLLVQFQCDYAADPELPHSWRYTRARAGAGALLDVGAHAIDMARFLVGEVAEVRGATAATWIKERHLALGATKGHDKVALSAETRPVDNDDIVSAVLRFENGCQGLFCVSRISVGFGNTFSFSLSGTKGTVQFSTMEPGHYRIARLDNSGQYPFRTVRNRPSTPYVAELLPVPYDGIAVGYAEAFGFMIYEFLAAIAAGKPMPGGTLLDGLRAAEILDAIDLAAARGGSVAVKRSA